MSGEYDPRAPIASFYGFSISEAPAELWMLPDQHHNGSITHKSRIRCWKPTYTRRVRLAERSLRWRATEHPGKTLWLEPSGGTELGERDLQAQMFE